VIEADRGDLRRRRRCGDALSVENPIRSIELHIPVCAPAQDFLRSNRAGTPVAWCSAFLKLTGAFFANIDVHL
jgi:hypothetical protein